MLPTLSADECGKDGHPFLVKIDSAKNDCFVRGLAVPPGVAAAAAVAGEGVFATGIMTSIAYMALPVPRFVPVEVVELLLAATWQRAMVAVTGIVAVVDVAVKTTVAVEPGAGSEKDTTVKPVGPVVAIGCAVIGRVVEVAIGADGLHTNADRDLGCRYRRARTQQGCREN